MKNARLLVPCVLALASPSRAADVNVAPSPSPSPAADIDAAPPPLPAAAPPPLPAVEPGTQPLPPRAANPARDAPAPPAPESRLTTKKGLSGSIEAGGEWRQFYDIPYRALELRGTLGPADAFTRRLLPSAFASLMFGRTEAGLDVDHVVFGARIEGRGHYFYGGASVGAGVFMVKRVNGGLMTNLDASLDLFIGPEIPLGGNAALGLEGRVSLELLPGTDSTVSIGPGGAVRIRFY